MYIKYFLDLRNCGLENRMEKICFLLLLDRVKILVCLLVLKLLKVVNFFWIIDLNVEVVILCIEFVK